MNRRTWIVLAVAVLAAAALVVVAVRSPRVAAGGWLLAFGYVAAFPLGALAMRLIHRLTGGRWGEALEPFLRPLSLAVPLLVLLLVPVLIATPVLFPWVHGDVEDVTATVRAIYLNIPSYVIRALIALCGLGAFAVLLPNARSRSAPLVAGLGLLFYAVAISFMGLDWLLAAQAPFFSTSFGASVAFTQLLAVLALAALVAPSGRELPDLGALMLVVTLGITYVDFMAVLVIWYGDVPARVFWFVERIAAPWRAMAVGAFVLTSLVPIAALMFARVRTSRLALRFIAASSLVGLALYQAWLLAPAYGPATLATGLLALVAMVATAVALGTSEWTKPLGRRWRAAHG